MRRLRGWIKENEDVLMLGFLMGATPGICELTALVFRLIARSLL